MCAVTLCGCLTAYGLASEICGEFNRLQGWRFEPCETFKASELNKKISRRAAEWYIGTNPSSFCLLSRSLLNLAAALVNSEWTACPLVHLVLEFVEKERKDRCHTNPQPETYEPVHWNISSCLLCLQFVLYLRRSPEKWDGAVPLDLLTCPIFLPFHLHNLSLGCCY